MAVLAKNGVWLGAFLTEVDFNEARGRHMLDQNYIDLLNALHT